MDHPVRLKVARVAQRDRLHIAIRVTVLLALGAIGFSSFSWVMYLAAPAVVALLITQQGGAQYLAQHVPLLTRALHWLAAVCAWIWLLTDDFDLQRPAQSVAFELDPGPAPNASSALLRLLTSIPAALLMGLLLMVAGLLWIVGALAILISRHLPAAIADFLELTLRYQFRGIL